jgi:hypothetical protein
MKNSSYFPSKTEPLSDGISTASSINTSDVENLKPQNDREREIAAEFYCIGFADALEVSAEVLGPDSQDDEGERQADYFRYLQ